MGGKSFMEISGIKLGGAGGGVLGKQGFCLWFFVVLSWYLVWLRWSGDNRLFWQADKTVGWGRDYIPTLRTRREGWGTRAFVFGLEKSNGNGSGKSNCPVSWRRGSLGGWVRS
jgi:hypothetical protein